MVLGCVHNIFFFVFFFFKLIEFCMKNYADQVAVVPNVYIKLYLNISMNILD